MAVLFQCMTKFTTNKKKKKKEKKICIHLLGLENTWFNPLKVKIN